MKKRAGWIVAGFLLTTGSAWAQQPTGTAAGPPGTGPVANPVATTIKAQLTRYAKNMVAAADLMPAEKYNFKPTPEMNTFAHLTMHIAQANYFLCSKISGQPAPE